jgi:hypothetical protein
MKMKVCLFMRGKHYEYANVDYRKSVDNYREFIIRPLLNAGYTVDIFIATYDSDILDLLLREYSPSERRILDKKEQEYGNINTFQRQCDFHYMLDEMMKLSGKTYDIVVNMRFDLFFKVKITDMNIRYDQVNIGFKHSSGNCDEAFFILPGYYSGMFSKAWMRLKTEGSITHQINHYIDESIVNYMIDLSNLSLEDYYKKQWTYWNIMRSRGLQTD